MKNQFKLLTLGTLSLIAASCGNKVTMPDPGTPVFTQFTYTGKDVVYEKNPLAEGEFYNPILQGCYPDPSICKKGTDYYLVCSSFAINPGVPIFHSTDLVNWKQIGHVLDRPSQLKVEDSGISAGIYAPTIRYNSYNDTFYMITTQFSGGMGNMIVKTKDPMKGWSDPIKLNLKALTPTSSLMTTARHTSLTTMHPKNHYTKDTELLKFGNTTWKKTRLFRVQTKL